MEINTPLFPIFSLCHFSYFSPPGSAYQGWAVVNRKLSVWLHFQSSKLKVYEKREMKLGGLGPDLESTRDKVSVGTEQAGTGSALLLRKAAKGHQAYHPPQKKIQVYPTWLTQSEWKPFPATFSEGHRNPDHLSLQNKMTQPVFVPTLSSSQLVSVV